MLVYNDIHFKWILIIAFVNTLNLYPIYSIE